MGDWHFPEHYTSDARAYQMASRKAQIAVFHDAVLPAIRAVARERGYAIAEHGTMARDVDLVAIPWTEEAGSAVDLIKAIGDSIKAKTGWGQIKIVRHEATIEESLTPKPHGRVATTIIADADVQVDLSVMPRMTKPEDDK